MSSFSWDCNEDAIFPFHLQESPVRGRIVRLSGVMDDLLERHNYPEAINSVIAEAVVLTALIGQLVNFGWKFSIQFRSDGPLRLAAADYLAPETEGEAAKVRAYASFRHEELKSFGGNLVSAGSQGYLAMLIDKGDGREPFKGLTPLSGKSLSECAEEYFRRSEQIPTRVSVATGWATGNGMRSRQAGGIMIQRMAPASGIHKGREGPIEGGQQVDRDEDWTKARAIFSTIDGDELLGPEPSPSDLLYRLFHDDLPMVADCQPVEFGCTCSAERVRTSMSIYSAKDIARMTTKQNLVVADCQFCGAHYELDPSELGFEAAAG